jgi:hypothetical protein
MGELTLTSSVIRVVRRAHAVEAACTPARSNPSTAQQHLIAHHPRAKPTNISRRQSSSVLFSLLPFTTTPDIYSIRATLTPPHTLPRPPHALYHTSPIPACPCPTHRPSCDSTTIRLTTPRYPYDTSRASFPSSPTCRLYPLLNAAAPTFTIAVRFLSTSHPSNHSIKPAIQGPVQHPAIAGPLSSLQETIDRRPPPMRASNWPNPWRIK